MYSETALNIALPQLSIAFGVDMSLIQWLVVGYMLVIGIVLPLSSLLMKWFSARTITLFALGTFLIGSLISGFSPSFTIALIGRAIQGIGTGLVLPLMFAMVVEVIPPHKIGAAMGVVSLVIMFAPAVGPTLAGLLAGMGSWRLIFFSFAAILAVAIAFAVKFLVNPYKLTRPRIDFASIALSMLGFGGVVLGTGMASLFGWVSAPVVIALVVGIASLAFYARRQLSLDAPVLNLRALAVPGFRLGTLLVMMNFGITLTAMYVLPQYIQNGLLIAVALIGMIILPGGIVNALVSMIAGRLFDKMGARPLSLAGFALSAVALTMLITASEATAIPYVIACHVLMMIGVPLAMSPAQTHALSSLPHKRSTDGSAIMNTLQQVVGALCTAIATSLVMAGQNAMSASDGAVAFTNGAHWGFGLALALALAFRLKPLARPAAQEAPRNAGIARQPVSKSADRIAAASEIGVAREAEATVRGLMKTEVFVLRAGQTAYEALELFADKGISGAPILDAAGNVAGFVSDGDVFRLLANQVPTFTNAYSMVTIERNNESFAARMEDVMSTTVEEIATKRVFFVNVDDSLAQACELLVEKHLKKAPVMKDGAIVGILNRSNITRYSVENYRR